MENVQILQETLVERIAERLEYLGTTPRKVSLAATGKPDTIRNIQRGAMPSIDRMVALASELECSVSWLVGDKVDDNRSATVFDIPPRRANTLHDRLDNLDLACIRAIREFLLHESDDALKRLQELDKMATTDRSELQSLTTG